MNSKNKVLLQNYIAFFIFLLFYLIITLFLFHRQSVNYAGKYVSDIPAYITEMQYIDNGYNPPYPLLFLLGQFFRHFTTPQHAMAFAVTLLNGLTAPALKYFFDATLRTSEDTSCKMGLFSSLLVFTLLFASMLYPVSWLGHYNPPGENYLYRYLGIFTPNPYQNATYLAARPFSVFAFFLFAEILEYYEKKDSWFHSKYILMGLSLFLTTIAKPSFTLVFAATAGLIMIFRLIRSRFNGLKAFFQCGIWFIPTFFVLLYQFGSLFRPQDDTNLETGIGFGFLTAWSTICDNIPMAVLRATAFPLTVLLFCAVNKKLPSILKFTWQFFGVSLATLLFLYEKGYRMVHINFSWGYMYGLFFLYTVSLLILVRKSLSRSQPNWQLDVQWGIYFLHLICGLDYFRILLQGGLFH